VCFCNADYRLRAKGQISARTIGQIVRKSFEICPIQEQEFRKNMVEISDTRKLLPQLQKKLLTCKMNPGKKVQDYYEKMEQLLHDLIDAALEGGDYDNGKDIDRLLYNQVLNAFISGLPESYLYS